MRTPRIHVDANLRPGIQVMLPDQAGEHVARVLRMECGHALILFNGDGHEYDATLATLTKRTASAEVTGVRAVDRESPLRLTLAQGIARGDKMDWILQKATELGIARIVPLITERTEVKLDEDRAERRVTHWRGVVAGACEQSGRTSLPEVGPAHRIDRWLGSLSADDSLRLALLPQGNIRLRDLPRIDTPAIVCVGPEGGFSANDVAMLVQANFHGLRLGPRILRTETAGIAAIAALQAIAGDL